VKTHKAKYLDFLLANPMLPLQAMGIDAAGAELHLLWRVIGLVIDSDSQLYFPSFAVSLDIKNSC
jgi:hypothetical protein